MFFSPSFLIKKRTVGIFVVCKIMEGDNNSVHAVFAVSSKAKVVQAGSPLRTGIISEAYKRANAVSFAPKGVGKDPRSYALASRKASNTWKILAQAINPLNKIR